MGARERYDEKMPVIAFRLPAVQKEGLKKLFTGWAYNRIMQKIIRDWLIANDYLEVKEEFKF